MDSVNLRRKDTTKGPPLRILSLDGGGVRGYSMLIILQELMHRAFVETEGRPPTREEASKPCEYFDLIAGTGTGGLIAIMLGRLRLDLETCMEVYVRMTRKVFETDKTIIGIPYKTTLFKASKLEEAIKACVKEHTIFEDEGNDGTQMGGKEFAGMSPVSATAPPRRSTSVRSNSTLGLSSPSSQRNSMLPSVLSSHWGNPEASLYDGRENRTKTAVTAVYKGTSKTGSSILLRSYDSRREPPPEFNCTIWQAGRATSATGLAFKPIQIGQSIFSDEGAGKYNPSPQVLEEATNNEWPGREVGVFVSIGTGKRPPGTNQNSHEWWEGFVGGSIGNFAEARRRLILKIEGCEDTHIQMLNSELPKRGVPIENYFRLNVEVGVGEFGMNEWDRLSEMTSNTRRYTKKPEVQQMMADAAHKLGKVELAKRRYEGQGHRRGQPGSEPASNHPTTPVYEHPSAVELPADEPNLHAPYSSDYILPVKAPHPPQKRAPSGDKFIVVPGEAPAPRVSAELPYRTSKENIRPISQLESEGYGYNGPEPPPRPPKTPIEGQRRPFEGQQPPSQMGRGYGNPLPYPDNDGPPPIVNKLRKPEFTPR